VWDVRIDERGIAMCRVDKTEERQSNRRRRWWGIGMGVKVVVADKEKSSSKLGSSTLNNGGSSSFSRSKMKLWMVRATTSILLWTCVVQLTTLGEVWGPRVLKGWPSCFSQDTALDLKLPSSVSVRPRVLPPKSKQPYLAFHFIENNFACLKIHDLCANFYLGFYFFMIIWGFMIFILPWFVR